MTVHTSKGRCRFVVIQRGRVAWGGFVGHLAKVVFVELNENLSPPEGERGFAARVSRWRSLALPAQVALPLGKCADNAEVAVAPKVGCSSVFLCLLCVASLQRKRGSARAEAKLALHNLGGAAEVASAR